MTIHFVAFIGKNNEPLHFYSRREPSELIQLQMIAYSCLDVVDERLERGTKGASTAFDMYLGYLLPVDDYRVFCSYSNTQIKTMVICDNSTTETPSKMIGKCLVAVELVAATFNLLRLVLYIVPIS